MQIRFSALPTSRVAALRNGALDANGQPAERMVSDGSGNPCRHCLGEIAEGAPMLVLAYRPFGALQPYAETGPIFLCGEPCERAADSATLPEMFRGSQKLILRGYDVDERIVYGTGTVIETREIEAAARALFKDDGVRFIHLRSASNNCYQARLDRAA